MKIIIPGRPVPAKNHPVMVRPGLLLPSKPYRQYRDFCLGKGKRPGWLLAEPEPLNELVPEILAGPERIESGWWDGADRRRDYYVVRTRDGRLAWVWQAVDGQGPWMLHGWFA